jgi:hypothetical protein
MRKRRPMAETYFCHICSRSGSPSHNKMIFCDLCDCPYHQHCHVPLVEDSIFTRNNKWFCSTCITPAPVQIPTLEVKKSSSYRGSSAPPDETTPGTPKLSSNSWSVDERDMFHSYLAFFGQDWHKISGAMGTKTADQVC